MSLLPPAFKGPFPIQKRYSDWISILKRIQSNTQIFSTKISEKNPSKYCKSTSLFQPSRLSILRQYVRHTSILYDVHYRSSYLTHQVIATARMPLWSQEGKIWVTRVLSTPEPGGRNLKEPKLERIKPLGAKPKRGSKPGGPLMNILKLQHNQQTS